MPEVAIDRLVEVLVEALEQMAFIMLCPLEEPAESPADPVLARVQFDGPVRGHVDLLTGKQLGIAMAANMLASSIDDPQVVAQANDTLRELLNVTCGAMLNEWMSQLGGTFQMQIPSVTVISKEQWQQLMNTSDFMALDAEGQVIAIRLVKSE
ncbi:MAG: chemotaxis protein CheX [Bacillota bacterium]